MGGPDVADGVGVAGDVAIVPPGLAKDLVQARVATCRDAVDRIIFCHKHRQQQQQEQEEQQGQRKQQEEQPVTVTDFYALD